MGVGPSGPSAELYDAIIDRWEELRDVVIVDVLALRPTKLYDIEYMKNIDGHVTFAPMFGNKGVRPAFESKLTDYMGGSLTSFNAAKMAIRTDVYCTMVTPPNENGYCNIGLANFYGTETIRRGRERGKLRVVIAEVNDQMPEIFGDNYVHVSEIDHFIEHSSPIPEFPRAKPGEVEKAIAGYVADQIHDGDTIQMGIGSITEAIIPLLENKHGLGVHSEMFPPALNELMEKGIVTNRNKPIHKGINIGTFCFPDRSLREFITRNPQCNFYGADYTNHPQLIASHPNMKSINMCIMVDFLGQVAAEGIGTRMVSGAGGQPEFQLGAYFSDGGQGITVLTSARKAKDGSLISSIVPTLPAGTPVTVPRTFVDTVVTEYGVAKLKAMSQRQRCEALINISHPDLRGQLREEARRIFNHKPVAYNYEV